MSHEKQTLSVDRVIRFITLLFVAFGFVGSLLFRDVEFLLFWIYLAVWWLLIRLAGYFRRRERTALMYTTLVILGLWGVSSIPLGIIEHGYLVFWTFLIITLVMIVQKAAGRAASPDNQIARPGIRSRLRHLPGPDNDE